MTLIRVILVAILVISPLVSSAKAVAAPKKVYTGKEGAACKVLSGPNKGKTGTYDSDGDCCGKFGCTECKNSDGTSNGKCADKAAAVHGVPGQIRNLQDTVNNLQETINSLHTGLDNILVRLDGLLVLEEGLLPDLVPLPFPDPSPVGNICTVDFCRINPQGKLHILVQNQGVRAAGPSQTQFFFRVPAGQEGPLQCGVGCAQVNVDTPALAGFATIEVVVDIPEGCFGSVFGLDDINNCKFKIAVDGTNAVPESNEFNNSAGGGCQGLL